MPSSPGAVFLFPTRARLSSSSVIAIFSSSSLFSSAAARRSAWKWCCEERASCTRTGRLLTSDCTDQASIRSCAYWAGLWWRTLWTYFLRTFLMRCHMDEIFVCWLMLSANLFQESVKAHCWRPTRLLLDSRNWSSLLSRLSLKSESIFNCLPLGLLVAIVQSPGVWVRATLDMWPADTLCIKVMSGSNKRERRSKVGRREEI